VIKAIKVGTGQYLSKLLVRKDLLEFWARIGAHKRMEWSRESKCKHKV
jgi:hypothetical protein